MADLFGYALTIDENAPITVKCWREPLIKRIDLARFENSHVPDGFKPCQLDFHLCQLA